MAVQDKFNDLKDRPHDEKKVVAGGIAIFVVIILLVAWGFLFLRKIRSGPLPELQNSAVPSDQFNMNSIQDTQAQNNYDPNADLRAMRDTAAQNSVDSQTDYTQGSSVSGGSSDQFGGN